MTLSNKLVILPSLRRACEIKHKKVIKAGNLVFFYVGTSPKCLPVLFQGFVVPLSGLWTAGHNWILIFTLGCPVPVPCGAVRGHCRLCSPLCCSVTILWLWMSWWAPEGARYSTSYCCFLSGKSIVIIVLYIYLEGENGPCNHSCRLWCSFSYFWVCALLLCQDQRKCLSKTFSHELVEVKRFLGEMV